MFLKFDIQKSLMHFKWEKIVWPLRVHMSCLFSLYKLLIWNYSRCFKMFIKFIPGISDICKYIATKWKMLRSRKKERCPLSLWPCLVSVWNRVLTGLLSLKAQSWLHWVVAEKAEGIHIVFLRTYLPQDKDIFFSNPFHVEHFNWLSLWRVKRVSGRWNWKLPLENSYGKKKKNTSTMLEVKEVLCIT